MLYLGDDEAVVRRVAAPVLSTGPSSRSRAPTMGGVVPLSAACHNLVAGGPAAVGDRGPTAQKKIRGFLGRVAMKAGDCADKVKGKYKFCISP